MCVLVCVCVCAPGFFKAYAFEDKVGQQGCVYVCMYVCLCVYVCVCVCVHQCFLEGYAFEDKVR